MEIPMLYLITALVFSLGDALGLRYLVKPVFDRHVGHLFASPFRFGPAAIFYLGYIAGILWFVSIPALQQAEPLNALLGGALLGLFAYGTYELTNYATLRDWTAQQVIVDGLWGAFLTGIAAWAGVAAVQAMA